MNDRTGFTIDIDISPEDWNQRHWLTCRIGGLTCRAGEIIVARGEDRLEVKRLSLDTVEAARTVACVGCGILQIKVAGEWRDLLHFSNARSERFHQVSRRLDRSRRQHSRCRRRRARSRRRKMALRPAGLEARPDRIEVRGSEARKRWPFPTLRAGRDGA